MMTLTIMLLLQRCVPSGGIISCSTFLMNSQVSILHFIFLTFAAWILS